MKKIMTTTNDSSVFVLYTGGTCGMVPNKIDGSLEPSTEYLTNNLQVMAAEQGEGFPRIVVKELDRLLDSSDMEPEDWINIGKIIEENYFLFDGFVVIMGTDTMAYAASSLSFMMTNLAKPVIFTGAMLPLYKGYSDARRNILLSILIAGTTSVCEVCIFFQDRLLRANRAKKVKANALDAFDSPNFPPLAIAGTYLQLREEVLLPPPKRPFRLCSSLDSNVLVIRLIPGFRDDTVDLLIKNTVKLKALVLELYGVGNAPARKNALLQSVEHCVSSGIIVAICSQCMSGSVNLDTYSVGASLKRAGALSTLDMTVESVATKLAFLLGQPGLSIDDIKWKLCKSIRGEVTEDFNKVQNGKLPSVSNSLIANL